MLFDLPGEVKLKQFQAKVRQVASAEIAPHAAEVDKIRKDTDRDYFMSPEQARDYGIIDAVYSNAGDPLSSLGRPGSSGSGSGSDKGRSDEPGDAPAAAKG
jgi:hypothetical protein